MTKVEELIQYFNNAYGIEKEWPKTFEVSAELYGRCCQEVFNHIYEHQDGIDVGNFKLFEVALGKQMAGLIFKNVELIIK